MGKRAMEVAKRMYVEEAEAAAESLRRRRRFFLFYKDATSTSNGTQPPGYTSRGTLAWAREKPTTALCGLKAKGTIAQKSSLEVLIALRMRNSVPKF